MTKKIGIREIILAIIGILLLLWILFSGFFEDPFGVLENLTR